MAEPIAIYVTRAPRSAHLSSKSTIANDCIRPWPIDHRPSLRQTSRRTGPPSSSPARQSQPPPVPNYRVSLQGFTPVDFLIRRGHAAWCVVFLECSDGATWPLLDTGPAFEFGTARTQSWCEL